MTKKDCRLILTISLTTRLRPYTDLYDICQMFYLYLFYSVTRNLAKKTQTYQMTSEEENPVLSAFSLNLKNVNMAK